jgi:uncharacterized protein YjbJ (UPF0337 family)
VVEYLWVFAHVGFLFLVLCERSSVGLGQSQARETCHVHRRRIIDPCGRRPVGHVRASPRLSAYELEEKPPAEGVTVMGGKTDVVKGRIKEAAGALTGNDELREEGKTDQAVGKAEQAVQKAADTVKQAVKKVTG